MRTEKEIGEQINSTNKELDRRLKKEPDELDPLLLGWVTALEWVLESSEQGK